MAQTMLRIAADIDRLDNLTDQAPGARLGATPALARTAEALRLQVEQAARLKRCPVLLRLVEEDRSK